MESKIKKLIKQVALLNKLLLKVVELLGTLALVEIGVKGLIQIWNNL